ncbi:hypothetical protein M4D81_29705 [Paenibacillus sp. p3-SID867]|nr:hypothetical protein [Paenibacillus sp. p3-SID867]MCT1403175.1 hypothetical protein [Paenibacillus sp. p3-SID867]
MEGLFQLIGVLQFLLITYAIFSVIGHVNRSKKHDKEVIKILKEIKENQK